MSDPATAVTPPPALVTLAIDGREVSVPKGTLIISEDSLKGAISSPEILSLIKTVF